MHCLLNCCRDDQIADSNILTLIDLWDQYRTNAVTFLDNHEKTRLDAEARAEVLIGFFGGELDVTKLSENDQQAFANTRLAGGIRCDDGRITAAVRSRSAQADLKLLNTMLKWACTARSRNGKPLLDRNPLAGLRKPREKNPRRPVATWERFQSTLSAIQHLIDGSTTDEKRRKWLKLRMALSLAEATGRRIGSIRQLKWSDVDLDAESIHWRADTDKKGKAWRIPMPANLRDELKSFRLGLGGVFGGLLFPGELNADVPIRTDVFAKWLREAEREANLAKLDGSLWHSYRRAWATARKSLPVSDVAAAGGWTDLSTLLNCYQQVNNDTLLAVMNEPRKVTEKARKA